MELHTPHIKLEVSEIFNQGWALTKKHFPIFLLMYFLMQLVSNLPNYSYYSPYLNTSMTYGTTLSENEWLQMLVETGRYWSLLGRTFVFGILAFLITCHLNAANFRMLYAAVKEEKVDMTAELKNAFRCFWLYIGTYIVYLIIVVAGIFCCVFPGIYLGIRFMFVPIVVANHPEISFSEAFSRSWQMTKGHFGKLLWLGIIVCGINLLGLLCCCVGVFFTAVLSNFMLISIYHTLEFPDPLSEYIFTDFD